MERRRLGIARTVGRRWFGNPVDSTDSAPVLRPTQIETYADAGYDHVYVHQIGPDQEGFFEFYEEEVLPNVG